MVLYGIHAVAVLQNRGGCEGCNCNVDSSLPKGTECGKVNGVSWVVTARDPGLVLLCKEARAMDDANTNVNDVIIGDGMLGKVGNCSSPELVRNKELKPL